MHETFACSSQTVLLPRPVSPHSAKEFAFSLNTFQTKHCSVCFPPPPKKLCIPVCNPPLFSGGAPGPRVGLQVHLAFANKHSKPLVPRVESVELEKVNWTESSKGGFFPEDTRKPPSAGELAKESSGQRGERKTEARAPLCPYPTWGPSASRLQPGRGPGSPAPL